MNISDVADKVEYYRVDENWFPQLAVFFEKIVENGDHVFFHPHPFDRNEAKWIAGYKGKDLYFVQIYKKNIVGYAMLRGWNEGYDVPSLGIIIHPSYRHFGLGSKFMQYLHDEAKRKGASRVRLKVYEKNIGAMAMYHSLGYIFDSKENGQLIGFLQL